MAGRVRVWQAGLECGRQGEGVAEAGMKGVSG